MNEVINIDELGKWLKEHPEIERITVDNPYHENFRLSSCKGNVIWVPRLSTEELLNPNPDDTCQSKP